jgi:HlyD family secretion protein
MVRARQVVRLNVLAVAIAGVIGACTKTANPVAAIETASVTQQDIVVNVEATGVIEPVDAVQVKSKASGQIVKMPVVVGSLVKAGDLLVQVDPRQMQSEYNATLAALKSAQANLVMQNAQLAREDSMVHQGVVTKVEYEAAVAAQAAALSSVANAQANVDVNAINLADATVVSPVTGTVIDKSVSLGQVIASATNNVGGGTTLLTVADLGQVLDSALVNESDIGRVKIGQDAAVTVSAYPNHVFPGKVLRISPEALIQQSVTMFPVLVSLDNRQGMLLPGMSTDATIDITRLTSVVAVPNDAIGTPQEAPLLGAVLGIGTATIDSVLGGGRSPAGAAAGRGRSSPAGRGAASGRGGGGSTATTDSSRAAVVFVQDAATGKFALRLITIGAGNYEVTRALSGVKPGERVALLSDVRMAASRDTTLQRIQSRSGMPGMSSGGGGGGRGGGRD